MIFVLAPSEARVCALETTTANAPATPTLLPPAPAIPSAASLFANAVSRFWLETAFTTTSPARVITVPSSSAALVVLFAKAIPTPTATPTLVLGSTASPAPRALKLLVPEAFRLINPPDESLRPLVTDASTLSDKMVSPTAAATATLPPPWVPWFDSLVWLFLSDLVLSAPSACVLFWS